MRVLIKDKAGHFAENKDIAKEIRENLLIPAVDKGEEIFLDFKGVDSSTQSFIHALISEIFQVFGEHSLEIFHFENCNNAIKSLVGTVINYSLE